IYVKQVGEADRIHLDSSSSSGRLAIRRPCACETSSAFLRSRRNMITTSTVTATPQSMTTVTRYPLDTALLVPTSIAVPVQRIARPAVNQTPLRQSARLPDSCIYLTMDTCIFPLYSLFSTT